MPRKVQNSVESSDGDSLFAEDEDLLSKESEEVSENGEEMEEDEDEEEEEEYIRGPKLSLKECQAFDEKRLHSLARYRNVLKPFITDKVYNKLCASIEHREVRNYKDETENLIDQPHMMKNCVLREYQIEGLNWLVNNYNRGINCLLGDEMGLGKTIQSIAFLSHFIHVKKLSGPFLVVVPLTVLFNWMTEFDKFCPALDVLRIHTTDVVEAKRIRTRLNRHMPDVIVTTYEMLKTPLVGRMVKRIVYRAFFLDEGHRIRNELTEVSKACSAVKAMFKVVLTGTPLQNSLRETGVILSFLSPNIFTDLTLFENAFDLNIKKKAKVTEVVEDEDDDDKIEGANGQGSERKVKKGEKSNANSGTINRKLLDQAHYMMRPFLLRRLKTEVEEKLPPKLETMIECPLSPLQKEVTQFLLFQQRQILTNLERKYAAMNKEEEEAAEVGEGGKKKRKAKKENLSKNDMKSLLGLLAHLRKAANHPFLFSGIENVSVDGRPTEDIVTSSGKMIVLDKLLKKLVEKGHRVVLFSQFTRTLDIICDYLDWRGYIYKRLDGATNRVMREVNVKLFNRPKSPFPIFALSTRAGGEGVNLFTADTVILFDSDWNPQVDIQAMARVHRIGQTKTVHVYRLVTKASVDECVVARAQKKLFLDSMVSRGSTKKGKELDDLKEKEEEAVGKKRPRDDDDDDYGGKEKRSRLEGEEGKEEDADSESDNQDLEGLDPADTNKVFAAIKFGWNSVFSMRDGGAGKADDCVITDQHIDNIIDRKRGLKPVLQEEGQGAAVKEKVDKSQGEPAQAVTTVSLVENQETSAATFDENAPLITIDHVRTNLLANMERELAGGQGSDKTTIPGPVDEEVELDEGGRGKRNRMSRTVEMNVPGVGVVQIFRSTPTPSNQGPRYERNILAGFGGKKAGTGAGGGVLPGASAPRKQVAGRDYDHQDYCLICWNGGELLVCDHCPASFHLKCLGLKTCPPGNYSCPHHKCYLCKRSTSQAGLLFRCEVCPRAYCEDCLPGESEISGDSELVTKLKYRIPGNCCYVRCSRECIDFDEKDALEGDGEATEEYVSVERLDDTGEDEEVEETDSEEERRRTRSHKKKSDKDNKKKKKSHKKKERTSESYEQGKDQDCIQSAPKDSTALDPSDAAELSARSSALDFCLLEDVKQRLSRDEHRISCRFNNLAEVPNLDARLVSSHPSIPYTLLNLINFIIRSQREVEKQRAAVQEEVKKVEQGETSPLPTSPMSPTATSPLAQVANSVEEAISLVCQFSGVPTIFTSEEKTKIFLETVSYMTSLNLSRSSVENIGGALGISAISAMRFNKRVEPKFSTVLSGKLKVVAEEEAIVAFLVVLSPMNLLLPPSFSTKVISITFQHGGLAAVEEEGATGGQTMIKKEKKINGIFIQARFLQALAEPVLDENKRFFTARVLKDEDPTLLSTWQVLETSRRSPRGGGSVLNAYERKVFLMKSIRPATRLFEKLKEQEYDVEDVKLTQLLRSAYLWEVGRYDPLKGEKEAEEEKKKAEEEKKKAAAEEKAKKLQASKSQASKSASSFKVLPEKTWVDLVQVHSVPDLPLAYLPENAFPLRGIVLEEEKVIRQVIAGTYTIGEEMYLMLLWLLSEQAVLERFEMGNLATFFEIFLTPLQAVERSFSILPPGSWRAQVPTSFRSQTLQRIHSYFVSRGYEKDMRKLRGEGMDQGANDKAYHNQLIIYELAFLTLCNDAAEYHNVKKLELAVPLIMQKFQFFVKRVLERRVLELKETRAAEQLKEKSAEEESA